MWLLSGSWFVVVGSVSRGIRSRYNGRMSRVEEIERAIQELSQDEFAQIAQRVHALEQERWDAELDRDASSGKLDFLIAEAQEDRKKKRLKDWPDPG
jgi:hypothetical protein